MLTRFGKLILAAAIVLPTGAVANMPPPEFDRPYYGKMEKHLVRYGEAARKCRSLGADVALYVDDRHLYGCQFWREDGTCVIVYSWDTKDKQMKSNVYRHERGHCHGWEH